MKKERLVAFVATCVILLSAQSATAQFDLNLFGDPERVGSDAATATATVTTRLAPVSGTDEVLLSITVATSDDAWTYAMGGSFSGKTTVSIDPAQIVGLTALEAEFTPDHSPKREHDEVFMMEVDKFPGGVTWTRRFRRDAAGDSVPQISGTLVYNLCTAEACQRHTEQFTVTLADAGDAPLAVENVADAGAAASDAADADLTLGYMVVPTRTVQGEQEPDPIRLQFQLAETAEGDWLLTFIMELDDDWHTYALEPTEDQNEVPTTIEFTELSGLEAVGGLESVLPHAVHQTVSGTTSNIHEHQAAWTQRFRRVGNEPVGLVGTFMYQLCNSEKCLIPKRVEFALGNLQDSTHTAGAAPATLKVSEEPQLSIVTPETEASGNIAWQLILAFLGGLILNVMPCVLPVIAIKILSFVQQAGESRTKVLALNMSYTAGVLTVFLTLATLAMAISLGWGTQFQNVIFTMSMAAVVFVMALSLLGVFEIPIPGFAGGGHQREGLPGAYLTGIIATLLGVPCTGPLMAAVFAWALKQPPSVTYAVFTSMGLGMASPYFVAGFFPGVVELLPKPGMWMERFKQFLGFILMGTVIWLIYVLPDDYRITFMVFLLGLSMAFWMIGSMYNSTSPVGKKWKVRLSALVCIGIFSSSAWFLQFGFGEEHHLHWEPFTEQRMAQLVEEGRPVLIDFTANWCQICKTNEFVALNRQGTKQFVEEHNVATLMADYTQENPEIKKWLNEFQQDSVPLTVIIPPRRGTERVSPILISGPYSQAMLLEKLEEAVLGTTRTASAESGNEVTLH